MLIFDNATLLEEESYSLLLRLFDSCGNVVMLLIVDQDHKSLPIMPSLEKPRTKEEKNRAKSLHYCADDYATEKEFVKTAKIIDVPSLSVKDLR